MSQGRINPAMLMQAAASMAAQQMKTFTNKKFWQSDAKRIKRHSQPSHGECLIAYNSGVKKRMRRARRGAA